MVFFFLFSLEFRGVAQYSVLKSLKWKFLYHLYLGIEANAIENARSRFPAGSDLMLEVSEAEGI